MGCMGLEVSLQVLITYVCVSAVERERWCPLEY